MSRTAFDTDSENAQLRACSTFCFGCHRNVEVNSRCDAKGADINKMAAEFSASHCGIHVRTVFTTLGDPNTLNDLRESLNSQAAHHI